MVADDPGLSISPVAPRPGDKIEVIKTNVGQTHYVGDDCPGGHHEMISKRRDYGQGLLAQHDREVRVATLIEAAQLVCEDCEAGSSWVGQWYDLVDKFWRVEHPLGFPCRAESIVKKLVEEWA